jgi:hypothetical protein
LRRRNAGSEDLLGDNILKKIKVRKDDEKKRKIEEKERNIWRQEVEK